MAESRQLLHRRNPDPQVGSSQRVSWSQRASSAQPPPAVSRTRSRQLRNRKSSGSRTRTDAPYWPPMDLGGPGTYGDERSTRRASSLGERPSNGLETRRARVPSLKP